MAGKNATIANLDLNVRAKIDELGARLKKAEDSLLHFSKVNSSVAASLKRVGETALGVFSGIGITKVIDTVTGSVTGLISKFVDLGKQQMASILDANSLATILGTDSNALRGLWLGAERATLGQAELDTALIKTGKNVEEAMEGNKQLSATFKDLGLDASKLKQERIDVQFLEILKAIEKIPNANERVRVAMQIWGKSGAQILQASSAGFIKAEQDAAKFGLTISEVEKENVEGLHSSITDLFARIDGLATKLLTGVAPQLTHWLEELGKLWDNLGSVDIANRVIDAIEKMANAMIEAFNKVSASVGGIEGAFLRVENAARTAQAFWNWGDSPIGDEFKSEKQKKALAEVGNRIKEIDDRLRAISNPTHLDSIRLPRLGVEAPPPTTPNGNVQLAPTPVGFPYLIATLPDAVAKGVRDGIPQSFGIASRGTVEAQRAIFEASRAAAEERAAAKQESLQREANRHLANIDAAVNDNNLDVEDI